MCVHVLYKGRTGNNLFQYTAARLFAQSQRFMLLTPPPVQDLLSVSPFEGGTYFDGPSAFVTEAAGDILDRDHPPGRYIFDGWFQRSDWYLKRRDKILEFLRPRPIENTNTEDIVINLRVGTDYLTPGWVIHPKWYLDILAKESFRKLHIVADSRHEGYLSWFSKYDPIVVASGPRGDWEYLRSFDRIICSNSTFCWWAAFFSGARRTWIFKRWVPHPDAHYGPFPGGEAVDGPFLNEV